MRIGLFLNSIATEHPLYTSTRLAMTARRMGHEVWTIETDGWAYDPDDVVRVQATAAPDKKHRSGESYLEDLRGPKARRERLGVTDFDVIMLRSNPADEVGDRAWAQSVGLIFGQMAAREGVVVVNDPFALAHATNKLYFQGFPREVRPKTLITRDAAEVKRFFEEHDGKVVLKPLQGSGGQSVFLVREGDEANLNQMIDAVVRDGYLVAQEYLPAAAEGDTRLILLNGRPLASAGKHAAVFRAAQGGDMRSNIHAGGKAQRAKITDRMLEVAEAVRPKLMADGMFLVGLDIAGDKLMEVNVFSPGGMSSMCDLEECDFFEPIVASLENKVAHRARYGTHLPNKEIAVL